MTNVKKTKFKSYVQAVIHRLSWLNKKVEALMSPILLGFNLYRDIFLCPWMSPPFYKDFISYTNKYIQKIPLQSNNADRIHPLPPPFFFTPKMVQIA